MLKVKPEQTADCVAPERVIEVSYTQVDGLRLRHPARFLRWRPGRAPASCRLAQLEVGAPVVAAVPEG